MSPKLTEPNQLRQNVEPNTLRGFDTPARSWLESGAAAGARSRPGAPVAPRTTARRRASITPRLIGRIGLLLAVVGVLPFLSADPRWEQVGLGMMSLGVGVVLLAGSSSRLRSQAAGAGRSGPTILAALLGAPQRAVQPVIGGALALTGLFLLVDALASA
ncbi:MAG: hypothetical protein ACYDAN_02740 [Candidatus Limnocylindrales bacterium]